MSADKHPEWQLIATAPKDGTRILGRSRYGDVYHCRWEEANNEGKISCWWNLQSDDEGCPIWWMPALPDPPVESVDKPKLPLCPMCGNPVKSTDECQCGGPQPDGCILAQYGVRDKLRDRERSAESASGDRT